MMKQKQRNYVKVSATLLLLVASFLTIFVPMQVRAANPTITYTGNTGVCYNVGGSGGGTFDCGSTQDAFGVITSPNPSSITGQGLIVVFYCQYGGTTKGVNNIKMNSVTDTIGDTWSQVGNTGFSTFGNSGAPAQTLPTYQIPSVTVFVWFTNVVSTASATFDIIGNFFPTASACLQNLYLVSTGINVNTFNFNFGTQNVGTGLSQINHLIFPLASTFQVPAPANSLVFQATWTSFTAAETIANTNQNGGTLLRNVRQSTPLIVDQFDYYQYISSYTAQPYQTRWDIANTASGYNYNLGQLIVVFVPSSGSVSTTATSSIGCSNSSCGVIGGGTTIDTTTTYSLTANTTYYYMATSGNAGTLIQNITTKIASYTNANSGKGTDTYMLSMYETPVGTSITSGQSNLAGSPLTRVFNINLTIGNGQTAQFGHGGNLNIQVPANTTYAVGIISRFTGLSLYHTSTIVNFNNMVNSTEGTFSVSNIWSPPFVMIQANPNVALGIQDNYYLFFTGLQSPIVFFTSVTSTSVYSCLAGSTCTDSTSTTFATSISTITTLGSGDGSGSIALIGNLITYWPLWMFPLFMLPFGSQGLLIGFIMGNVLGALLNIIPLWVSFLFAIGTLYLLQKKF